jgi:MFS family permease
MRDESAERLRWVVFTLIAIAFFGDLYVYDSIGPVADLLQKQRHFTDTQIGLLNAIYSLPNIILVVVGGILVDRVGAATVALGTCAICLAGASLTALSPSFHGMVLGRLLFGVGAETLSISVLATIVRYFAHRNLALAMGLCIAVGRLGSFSADMSPRWMPHSYAAGWQPPLLVSMSIAGASLVGAWAYWLIDRGVGKKSLSHSSMKPISVRIGDLFSFPEPYWFLLTLAILWYAVIIAFRSTFAIKYFQHTRGLDLATAGAMNSYVFLAALVATPLFGWLCGRTRRYEAFLTLGAILLPASLSIMTWTDWSLSIATALIGISYSLVPAVLWPFCQVLVPAARFGLATGLISVAQNVGIAAANLIAGGLNDRAGAGVLNPAGYRPMMIFFTVASVVGAVFAAALWSRVGERRVIN